MWVLWRGRVNNVALYQGRGAGDWLLASDDRDPMTRARAASALTEVQIATPDQRRAALIVEAHLLDDPDEDVRTEATNGMIALAGRGEDINRILSLVTARLRGDAHPQSRVAALHVLGAVGPEATPAVPTIVGLLTSSSPAVRGAAVAALVGIGAGDSATRVALASSTRDHESMVRETALEALMRLGADASTVLAFALPALEDTAPSVREQAAYTLGALRPIPATAINSLARLLWDPTRGARLAAADALGHSLPAPEARDALERAARDRDPTVRDLARAVLDASAAIVAGARPKSSARP
jgi:HEAT repeat protein